MRNGALIAITAAVVAAAAALYVFGVTRSDTRMQQEAGERQQQLFAAIRAKDVDAVKKIVRRPVDIYATDATGESALSLAEQSGDRKLLEALGPRHDREADLLRANRAAEFGYGIGLRPPPVEREFNVGNFIRDEAERARAEQQPVPEPDALADAAASAIAALPEGNRKQWAWRNLTIYLSSAGLLERARDLAVQLADPKMRGEMLINVLTHSRSDAERARSYEVARREMDKIEDASIRDPLYAQLAGISSSSGLANQAADTCRAIQEPKYRAGVCGPDAPAGADATPGLALSAPGPERRTGTPAASSRAASPAEPKATVTAYDRDRSAFRDLQGTWVAGNVTQNGKLHLDRALMSSTWIFRADDLYIDSELPQKKARQFSVEVDRRVRPHALRIESASPADRGGWMIFSREGSDLKVAFYPDFGRRPESFDAQDGLVVVRLTPNTQFVPVAANDGCGILRAAGAYDLPGVGTGEQWSRQYPNGGFECRVFGQRSAHLLVNPASESDYEQRINRSRSLKGYEFRDEPDFGARTYSMTSGGNLSFVAFKDGKIVQLNLTFDSGTDPARLRQVFGRVLEKIY